ncbi:sugar ABC transporter permease [Ktedonobacteria bacterium brp13]|nr:sugar ABC transporter permease [Ktedonobacteria bacterium brp13]
MKTTTHPQARVHSLQSLGTTAARLRGKNNEGLLGAVLVLLVVVVGAVDPQFWSLATVFNLVQNSFEQLVFALGFLLVLLVGGIDVSFDAIGIFAGYVVALLASKGILPDSIPIAFVVAALIGLLLGLLNAAIAAGLRLPVMIVTLGTRGLFTGFLLTFIGSSYVTTLPQTLGMFAQADLVKVHAGTNQTVGLNVLVIPLAILVALLAWLLSRTLFGRGLYAVGGDEEAARRVGFPVGMIKAAALCLAGVLAGLAGMIHITLLGYGNPFELVGQETNVIAAVVLGGASITGGKGSVLGTVLGVLLVSLINYSLVQLGIPSTWQEVAIGVLLVLGVSAQFASRRKQMNVAMAEEEVAS